MARKYIFYLNSFFLFFISLVFTSCSSTQTSKDNPRFHFFSNSTGVSYAGNRMRVKKLTPTQYRIKAYNEARKNK